MSKTNMEPKETKVMKHFALVLALAFAGILTLPAHAGTSAIPDEAILKSQLAALTAPIRSEADLESHLADRLGKDSPLDVLPPKARAAFLHDLVFTEVGLASLNHEALQGLSVLDAYRILGLFGWQDYAADLPGLRVTDDIDRIIREGGIHPKDECGLPDGGGGHEGKATGNVGLKCTGIRPWCREPGHRCMGSWPGRVCTPAGGYTCDRCSCHGHH